MSATCPVCDGDGQLDGGAEWATEWAVGGPSDDGHRYRIRWKHADGVRRALFRVVTDDRRCVLQHVRTVYVRQRGASRCDLDDTPTLDDVPDRLLDRMERDGFQPTATVADYV